MLMFVAGMSLIPNVVSFFCDFKATYDIVPVFSFISF